MCTFILEESAAYRLHSGQWFFMRERSAWCCVTSFHWSSDSGIPDGDELDLFRKFMLSQQTEGEGATVQERAAKQQRTQTGQKGGSGKLGKGKGNHRGQMAPTRSRRSSEKSQSMSDQNLHLLCQLLIRMVLRQGDALRIIALDTSFVVWLRTGLPAGVPEAMFTAAQKWKELREQGGVKAPLRHVLWMCLLTELEARTNPAKLTAEQKGPLAKMGFLKDDHWPFLKWSFDEEQLVQDTARSPLSMQDAHQQVKDLLSLSQDPSVITRFHPTRPLAPELKGPNITFLMSVALRSEQANELHSILLKLAGNACAQIVGMSHRQERLSRSNLEKQLSKFLQTGALPSIAAGESQITPMQAGHPHLLSPPPWGDRAPILTSNLFSVPNFSIVVTHATLMLWFMHYCGLHAALAVQPCHQD